MKFLSDLLDWQRSTHKNGSQISRLLISWGIARVTHSEISSPIKPGCLLVKVTAASFESFRCQIMEFERYVDVSR